MVTEFITRVLNKLHEKCNAEIAQLKSKVSTLEFQAQIDKHGTEETTKIFLEFKAKKEELERKVNELTPKKPQNETFYGARYKTLENIRYKSKRKVVGKAIDIELNQLFVPRQFEVQKHLKRINCTSKDLYNRAYAVGDYVAKRFTWTDDKNLDSSGDYYLYAEEALVLLNCDCEDHTFTVCSLEPEIDGAYGFYIDSKKVETGHAFNCFVYKDELYVMDTVGNKVEIHKYNDQSNYRIHYIITQNKTYEVTSGVRFGEIAGWN